MEQQLKKVMEEKGYSPITIKQKLGDLKVYFKEGFEGAIRKMKETDKKYLQASRSNKISSLLRLLPSLEPKDKKQLEAFREEQRKLNEKKNKYYADRKNDVPNDIDEIREKADEFMKEAVLARKKKRVDEEKEALRNVILARLYVDLQDHIGRGLEFRNLRLFKPDDDKNTKNYLFGKKMILNRLKKKSKVGEDGDIESARGDARSVKIQLPETILKPIKRLRKLSTKDEPFVFGGDKMMAQGTYSKYQKKTLGYSTNDLRKMIIQHREGIKKEDIKKRQEVAEKADHSASTQRDYYS